MYDIVIKNGSVIDGTGAVAYHSDIAISDGRIVRIARNITDESKKYIDASGLTVCAETFFMTIFKGLSFVAIGALGSFKSVKRTFSSVSSPK